MSTHAVPEDADPRAVDLRERGEDCLRELGGDVAVHFVTVGPRLLGCVKVETGAGAEVVGIVLALDFQPSCRSTSRVSRDKSVRVIKPCWRF